MVDDILFNSNYFFFNLPTYSSGTIARIEAESSYFIVRLALPPRVSIG
jgi:hypothetical protein